MFLCFPDTKPEFRGKDPTSKSDYGSVRKRQNRHQRQQFSLREVLGSGHDEGWKNFWGTNISIFAGTV